MSQASISNSTVNVLIVDDDDVDAKGITRAFAKAKIVNPIFRAKDGIEALEILKGDNGKEKLSAPYILLVDINMPRMGGIEFVKNLRGDKELKSSIVFILTTSKVEEDINSAYDLNVAGYCVKEHIGRDFMQLVTMLDHYWRVIELPKP